MFLIVKRRSLFPWFGLRCSFHAGPGELLQMHRDDLDLFNNAIRVRCGVMKNKQLAAWKPIPPSMREYFETIPSSSEYLFPRKIGKRYVPINPFPYKLFRRCLKLAKIPGWRLHDARHEAVSGLLNGNTPEAVVCQIAGWDLIRHVADRSSLRWFTVAENGSLCIADLPDNRTLDRTPGGSSII